MPKEVYKNLIVITAPSGAGKSTLIKELMTQDPKLSFAVSHTTRSPRAGEQDGREYYFIDTRGFKSLIKEGALIEWARVHGHFYGTSKKEIARLGGKGKRTILDIDVKGSLFLQERIEALYIFITVARPEVLRERLETRGTDQQGIIEKRLNTALWELEQASKWQHVVVNDDFDRAFNELKQIIYSCT